MTIARAPARANLKTTIPPSQRSLLSEDESATMLGISKPVFRRLVKAGMIARVEIPHVRRNLYRREQLDAMVTNLGTTHDVRPRPANCVGIAAQTGKP